MRRGPVFRTAGKRAVAALAGIEPNGDFIKNQTSFATYYGGATGWYSSNGLDVMVPGVGYMLQMKAADELIYAVPTAKTLEKTLTIEHHNVTNWSPDSHKYEHSMAITGVIVDGGIRRGTHVLKAMAMGATACSGGRMYLYALAGAGTAGVDRAMRLLRDEMKRDMLLMGCTSMAQLRPSMLATRGG